jgi:glutamine amidotransferase
MCRLFGFRSSVPSGAHRSLVEAENALASQAGFHSDGWGIGYFLGDEAYIMKSERGAAEDERFDRLSRRLESSTFVVHVRRATVGDRDLLNSHPFRHGAWVFAHNGTVYGFDDIRDQLLEATAPELASIIFGRTDSEHIFYYLLTALRRAGVPSDGRAKVDVDVAGDALRAAVDQLFRWSAEAGNPPPILNFILTNGRIFMAQRAGLELYMATQKITCGDFLTCKEPNKVCMETMEPLIAVDVQSPPLGAMRKCNHCLVASEPIGDEDVWEEIPDGMLLILDEEMHLHLRPPAERFVRCPSPPAPAPRNLLARAI